MNADEISLWLRIPGTFREHEDLTMVIQNGWSSYVLQEQLPIVQSVAKVSVNDSGGLPSQSFALLLQPTVVTALQTDSVNEYLFQPILQPIKP